MHIYYLKTFIFYAFPGKDKLFKLQISLLINLVLIRANNTCKTGILYKVIKASYNNRQVFAISQF